MKLHEHDHSNQVAIIMTLPNFVVTGQNQTSITPILVRKFLSDNNTYSTLCRPAKLSCTCRMGMSRDTFYRYKALAVLFFTSFICTSLTPQIARICKARCNRIVPRWMTWLRPLFLWPPPAIIERIFIRSMHC